jgi:hypothetical protein
LPRLKIFHSEAPLDVADLLAIVKAHQTSLEESEVLYAKNYSKDISVLRELRDLAVFEAGPMPHVKYFDHNLEELFSELLSESSSEWSSELSSEEENS